MDSTALDSTLLDSTQALDDTQATGEAPSLGSTQQASAAAVDAVLNGPHAVNARICTPCPRHITPHHAVPPRPVRPAPTRAPRRQVLALGGAVRCIVVADCWANRLLLVTREGLEITAIGAGAEGHADVHPHRAPRAVRHAICA